MKTIEINHDNLSHWQPSLPDHVIALGFFDGLHSGHQEVIRTAKREADRRGLPLSVMSFFPHPKSVLSRGKKQVDYLMPIETKKQKLKELGVDYFLIVEFSLEFAGLSPERFAADYLAGLNAVHVVCGFDYTYGKMGAGNISTLEADGDGAYGVTVVEKVDLYGEKISSTRIREALSEGDIGMANRLLGEPYRVEWCPRNGLLPYYTLPAPGAYRVTVTSGGEEKTGMINVLCREKIDFRRMTLPEDARTIITWHHELKEPAYSAI